MLDLMPWQEGTIAVFIEAARQEEMLALKGYRGYQVEQRLSAF